MASSGWSKKLAETHLRYIARKHGIKIRWVKGRDWIYQAEASRSARHVSIPHPHNARQYLCALHEFGHVLGPFQNRNEFPGYSGAAYHLLAETGADLWLAEHIHDDLDEFVTDKVIQQLIGFGFATHFRAVSDSARHGVA